MYRNAAHILSVCKDLYHWPERIKVGDNQIISQKAAIRNKSKGVIHMTAIATNPRNWCGVFLTAADWNKLRPRVKEMDVRYNVSGIREPDFTGVEPLVSYTSMSVCVRNGSKRNRKRIGNTLKPEQNGGKTK